MRLLFGTSEIHRARNADLVNAIQKCGIECRTVSHTIVTGFPDRSIKNWIPNKKKFNELIKEFRPDAVMTGTLSFFCLAVLDAGIPLYIRLRGNYWRETELDLHFRKDLMYIPRKLAARYRDRMIVRRCFAESEMILPVCEHLADITGQKYPGKVKAVPNIVNEEDWHKQAGMSLKHPCVGLLQGAAAYDKAAEILTIEKALQAFPNVTFYWAGQGQHADMVLEVLKKYKNFTHLGWLEYPDKVRQYLSEIDIYLLPSAMEMMPNSLMQAQMMGLPVIATRVGGTPEAMKDGVTGFLIDKGSPDQIVEKIRFLLDHPDRAKEMGDAGHEFVKEHFNEHRIGKEFAKILRARYGK